MKVSFSGIYDIRYPYGTKAQDIKRECDELKEYVNKKHNTNGQFSIIRVELKDTFSTQKTNKKLADSGIRVISNFDNPFILADVFSYVGKNKKQDLVQEYIDNSKVELVIDT